MMEHNPIDALAEEFLKHLNQEFPLDFLTRDEDQRRVFGKDWTKVFQPDPSAVVFPRTTDEVSRFLRLCSKFNIAVVPSGGRTGLSGGAVASQGEIALSLSRMNRLGAVDLLSQTLRVQAGAVTEAVHHHCAAHGLTWPIDFASKGSSHVGGNISTNAGGVKVIRYGLTRNWVLGLQVVTMDGNVLELNGALEKNNTGIDLRHIFIGSEGTLGIVTEATLKLTRIPTGLDVFFFAVEDIPSVLRLFEEVRKTPFPVMAFEFLTQNCLDLVLKTRGLSSPFSQTHNAYVLFEIERPDLGPSGAEESQSKLHEWLESLFDRGMVKDGTLAQSPREAKDLWSLREGISESLAHRGFVHKNDIALPITHLNSFIAEMYALFAHRSHDFEVFLFGHIGDGNLHVNTLKPDTLDKDIFVRTCHELDQDLFALVKKYQGSISAEHGIGLLKKKALHFSRSPEELALMKGLKRVFDPKGLLNPGKIFD